MRKGLIIPLGVILIGVGCSQPITLAPRAGLSTPRHIVDSSASVDSVAKAVVGNPLLKVKDYWVTTQTSDSMTPSSGFTFTGGPNSVHFSDGEKLKVMGETKIDGSTFKVLGSSHDSMLLLVDAANGRLYPKVINGIGGPTMVWTFKSVPENIVFTGSTLETIAASLTYVNYEFIYSGKNGNVLNFLYREYTAQDLVKPAFSQTVTYDVSDKIIQFKNIKLEVLEVGSISISTKVLAL